MAVSIAPIRQMVEDEGKESSALDLTFIDNHYLTDAEDPFNLPSNMFCNVFRLSKDMVRHIVDVIKIRVTPDFSAMPIERQVLITLMVYATGEYQQWTGVMAPMEDCSDSEINGIIKRVTLAISHHMLHWIKFPVSFHERNIMKQSIEDSETPFPGAFGVMDNFHVKIAPPEMDAALFWNNGYKCHSLNIQLICGSNLKVLYVNSRFPGASHDNIIWVNSSASKNLSDSYDAGERDTWLLGDGNYALQPWLMTPVPPSMAMPGTPEERYNEAHTKTLDLSEKCVRALRGTWRILNISKAVQQDPVVVANMVNVCCVLHNMRCAANAPPIYEEPKKRAKKRRSSGASTAGSALEASFAESVAAERGGDFDGGNEAPRPGVEDAVTIEAARLEAQVAAAQFQEPPRKVLGSRDAMQNIVANQAAVIHNIPVKKALNVPPKPVVFLDESVVSDENNGGRKKELYLARRIQARLIAKYFAK